MLAQKSSRRHRSPLIFVSTSFPHLSRSRFAFWFEWGTLWILASDAQGRLAKESVRSQYDGTLFHKIEERRKMEEKARAVGKEGEVKGTRPFVKLALAGRGARNAEQVVGVKEE